MISPGKHQENPESRKHPKNHRLQLTRREQNRLRGKVLQMSSKAITIQRPPLSQEQVAELCGVAVYTVKKWAREGAIPAKKVGRTWKFPPDKVERFLGLSPGSMPIPAQ